MTNTRVTQNGLDGSVFATTVEAETGTSTSKVMSPASTTEFFNANFGNKIIETFVDGVDFDAGTDDRVTIAGSPGTDNNLTVHIDGVYQETSTWSIIGSELVFTAVLPSGISKIEISYRITVAIGSLPDQSVSYAKLASGLIADQATAEAGVSDSKLMTPLKTKQAINAVIASDTSPLQTGVNDTVYTFTHTLGRQPIVVELWGRMTTAIYGFAIGDELKISSAEGQSGAYYGAALWIENGSTTEVKANCNNSFAFFDAVSGGTVRIVQITDMDLYVKVIG